MTHRASTLLFVTLLLAMLPVSSPLAADEPIVALVGCVHGAGGSLELLFADIGPKSLDSQLSCSQALTRAGRIGRNPQIGEAVQIPARTVVKRRFLGFLTTSDNSLPVSVYQFVYINTDQDMEKDAAPIVGVAGCHLDPAGQLMASFVDLPSDGIPPPGLTCAALLTGLLQEGFDELNFLAVVPEPKTAETHGTIIWDVGGSGNHDSD